MCPCMFVQKKKTKCLFFIFVTACLDITQCVSFPLPCLFSKRLYLILLLNVCVHIENSHIPMQFHVGSEFCMVTL